MRALLLCLLLVGCGGGVYPDECKEVDENGMKTITITYPPIYQPFLPPLQIPPVTIRVPAENADQCR